MPTFYLSPTTHLFMYSFNLNLHSFLEFSFLPQAYQLFLPLYPNICLPLKKANSYTRFYPLRMFSTLHCYPSLTESSYQQLSRTHLWHFQTCCASVWLRNSSIKLMTPKSTGLVPSLTSELVLIYLSSFISFYLSTLYQKESKVLKQNIIFSLNCSLKNFFFSTKNIFP